MSDVLDQLQAAFGTTYRLERERVTPLIAEPRS
jgi:hypothetical protein